MSQFCKLLRWKKLCKLSETLLMTNSKSLMPSCKFSIKCNTFSCFFPCEKSLFVAALLYEPVCFCVKMPLTCLQFWTHCFNWFHHVLMVNMSYFTKTVNSNQCGLLLGRQSRKTLDSLQKSLHFVSSWGRRNFINVNTVDDKFLIIRGSYSIWQRIHVKIFFSMFKKVVSVRPSDVYLHRDTC